MNRHSSELEAVLARLAKLEAQNRKLKLYGLILFLAFGAVVVMGQAAPTPEVIEAQRFVLKDTDGNVRAWLGLLGNGSEFTLGNVNKQPMMTLKVGEDASDLHFLGSQNSGMNLGLDLGVPAISMMAASGSGKAGIAIPKAGPAFSLEDAKGFSAIVGTSEPNTPAGRKSHQSSAASLVLLDKAKNVLWKAP